MAQYDNREQLMTALGIELGSIEAGKLKPSDDELDAAIRDALDELNRIKPRLRIHEEDGDGSTCRWVLSTEIVGPPAWVDDVSELAQVMRVTNAGLDDEKEYLIDDADWDIRLDATNKQVLYIDTAIPTGDKLRLHWTTLHTLNDFDAATETTIPARDKQTLLLLAASNAAAIIARKASTMEDNTMGIDQVDLESFDRRWSRRSQELRKMASERLAPSQITAGAAGTSTEWETTGRLHGTRVGH